MLRMLLADKERSPTVASLTFILGALSAFAPFATDMYLASFPSLATYFHTTAERVQLSLSIFFFGMAVGQVVYGPLIDRYGRRRPLLAGVVLYVVASALILIAPNIETLIGLRLLQAFGGCAGMIVSRAIVRDLFEEHDAARVLSQLIAIMSLAPIIAPLLGGYILAIADWRAIFAFLTAFGIFCFYITAKGLPETLPLQQRHGQNLKQLLRTWGKLLVQRTFVFPVLAASCGMSCMFAFITGSPFVLMQLHGVSPQHYGWLFGLVAVGIVLGAQLNRMVLAHSSPHRVLSFAVPVCVTAALLLLLSANTHSLLIFMVPLWLCIATGTMINANSVAMAMRASGQYAGSASSLFGLMQLGLASFASSMVGVLHNDSPYPMVGIMFVSSSLGGLAYFFGIRPAAA